jgi:hypothetical protein
MNDIEPYFSSIDDAVKVLESINEKLGVITELLQQLLDKQSGTTPHKKHAGPRLTVNSVRIKDDDHIWVAALRLPGKVPFKQTGLSKGNTAKADMTALYAGLQMCHQYQISNHGLVINLPDENLVEMLKGATPEEIKEYYGPSLLERCTDLQDLAKQFLVVDIYNEEDDSDMIALSELLEKKRDEALACCQSTETSSSIPNTP